MEIFMKKNNIQKKKNRENEKGAAMVMILLISFLLLIASAGVLLESSMNTANVSDATADQQAYNAAESGIQSALNVLRGNVVPSPLLDPAKPSSDAANRIDYLKALKLNSSNIPASASSEARLSRWKMDYGTNDRVSIGDATKGYSYKISLIDPENNGTVTFNTSALNSGTNVTGTVNYQPVVNLGNGVAVTYSAVSPASLDVGTGDKNTNIGSFNISVLPGSSVNIPDTRFRIVVNMTEPRKSTSVVRGYIKAGIINNNNTNTVKLIFDSPNFNLLGTPMALTGVNPADNSLTLTPNVKAEVNCSMTQPEPLKLLIRSTGYGPRGSVKQLEATVQKNYFDGLSAPAALTLVGPSAGFKFAAGNSSGVIYSGVDAAAVSSKVNLPSIGVTNSDNLEFIMNNTPKSDLLPAPADVTLDTPEWLSNTYELDKAIQLLKKRAETSGSYFASGVEPTNFGNSDGTGITFCDGNCTFDGNKYGTGGGILVVTGTLFFKGNINFNGLIIVTGAGGLDRSGGGGGVLQGNTVIAPYDKTQLNNYKTQLAAYNRNPGTSTPPAMPDFLAPKYDISGGGNSTLRYNSNSVDNGLNAVSNLVLGVVEK